MINEIKDEVKKRGISRICHFTPSRSLLHILSDKIGVLATTHLRSDERSVFNPTDLNRFDRHPDHICCSIEYPNAWYFNTARSNEVLFKDWVVLLIRPHYLWAEGTKFCPVNAATGGGAYIAEGYNAFMNMFALTPKGSKQKRGERHLSCSPTDDQAEVLVFDNIHIRDLIAAAVYDESQAKSEITRFKLSGIALDSLKLLIAPDFYNKYELSNQIRAGIRPVEREYTGDDCE